MTELTEPRSQLSYGWSTGESGWGNPMNANLLRIGRFGFHPSVKSRALTAPPGSPVNGDAYIPAAGATGAWAGHAGEVAIYDGGWIFAAPRSGWTVRVDDESGLVCHDGAAWSAAVLRADRLATAWAHSQATGNPHAAVPSDIGAEPALPSGGASTDYLTGTKAWANLASAVRSVVLTGLSTASSAVVAATDTILVAIGKLQAQVSLRLMAANPTYTGNVYGAGSVIWRAPAADHYFSLYGIETEFGLRDLNNNGSTLNYPFVVKRGAAGEVQIGYSGGIRPVRIGGAIKNDNLAGAGARPVVALADGTLDDQDAAAFRGTIGALATDSPDFSGPLKQGGTTRITSGGGAWFTSMQSANLVGAGDRPVAADLTGTLQPKTPDQFRNMIFALASSLKGAANGVAELGADVKVPVAQLPSAALLALGADSTTAHRGDHGTTAYAHSQIATGNPHGTTPDDIGAAKKPSKIDVSASANLGSIDASAIKVTATDITLTCSGGFDGQGWDIIGPEYALGIGVPSGVTLYRYTGITVGPAIYAPVGGRALRVVRIDATTWIMPNLS